MTTWQERVREQERVRQEAAAQARALPRDPLRPWVWAVVGAAVLVWVAVLGWSAAVLPAQVPQHWSDDPTPDRWATRGEALASSALLPLVLAFPMPLLARLTTAWPDGINLPDKDWWLADGRRLRRFERMMRELLWLTVAWELVLFAAVDAAIVVAASDGGRLPSWGDVVPGTLTVLFVIGVLVAALVWFRRRPDDL